MEITDKQKLLAEGKAKGLTDMEACKAAGYKATTLQVACNQVARMMKNDGYLNYLNKLREESTKETIVSRIEMQEILSGCIRNDASENNTKDVVTAAALLAKLNAYAEPERHKIEFEVHIGGSTEG